MIDSDAPMVHITDLQKFYQKGSRTVEVLKGVCLRIEAGEMVSLIGASGSGKSTFLHLLGGLDEISSGSIVIAGKSLDKLSSNSLALFRNHFLGFVFQFHHLLNEFTALENVMMPALIKGETFQKAKELAEVILSDVGMDHRLLHVPGELSGGEQQRVALARALVLDPPLLLADEVTGNLDAKTAEAIHQLLFDLNKKRRTTILIVTHHRDWADAVARKLLLENGLIRERL